MPIWSLTLERLEKLKNQIAAKKAEHDELDALGEKDLWCNDLDEFVAEWEVQLKLDDEIQTGIRRMGRRASTKIGAGKGRKAKGDADYQPGGKAKAAKAVVAKVVPKAEPKAQQRFLEKFQAKAKPKPAESTPIEIDLSDDDFALLGKKATVKKEVKEESQPPAAVPDAAASRTKRAATTKLTRYIVDTDEGSEEDYMALEKPAAPKSETASASASDAGAKPVKRAVASRPKSRYVEDDSEAESDDLNLLGDVGAMVKGIGGSAPEGGSGGRLSLFAMSRPEAGDTTLPKLKTKASKANLDFDSHDDTNYEALAMSSPRKSTKADDLDDFLSDDDLPALSKAASTARATTAPTAASKAKAPLTVVPAPAKKARGRPAGSKNAADKETAPKAATKKAPAKAPAKVAAAKPKPAGLSPAAKAYAAKKAKARKILSDDEDEDDLMEDPPSPVPVKAKARPGRAAAAKKPIVIDDDDMSLDDKDESEDEFAMDDSE